MGRGSHTGHLPRVSWKGKKKETKEAGGSLTQKPWFHLAFCSVDKWCFCGQYWTSLCLSSISFPSTAHYNPLKGSQGDSLMSWRGLWVHGARTLSLLPSTWYQAQGMSPSTTKYGPQNSKTSNPFRTLLLHSPAVLSWCLVLCKEQYISFLHIGFLWILRHRKNYWRWSKPIFSLEKLDYST